MNPEAPNENTTFRRVRKRLRQHHAEKEQLLGRIHQLESSVANENRKAHALSERLHRLVSSDVSLDGPSQIVRMCINVDRRLADGAYSNVVYEESMKQLVDGLRRALQSR